jgi:hypothetical protein
MDRIFEHIDTIHDLIIKYHDFLDVLEKNKWLNMIKKDSMTRASL